MKFNDIKSFDHFTAGDTFNRMVLICSAITTGIGILGMIGWMTGLHILTSFGPKYIPMAPSVALAFLLLGSTWFLYELMPAQKFRRICALASVLFILLVALLNLIQPLTGAQIGIEEILVRRALALNPQAYGAGPMSPVVAACFLLTCIEMLLLLLFPQRRMAELSGSLSLIVISANLIILLGYLYRAPLLYGGEIRPVALPVGVAFVVLGVGLIATAGPDYFPLRLIVGHSVRALLLRSFLLVIFIVALVDGIFYNILSQLKLRITEAELQGISAVIYVTAASVIVLQLSRIIGGTIDHAEAGRRQAENALHRSYNELEIRVEERTSELAKSNEALQAEITERKKVEQKLNQTLKELEHLNTELERSNAELEQFAYIASHDLQEPLRMVSGFTQLLDRRYKGKLDKSADEFITYIIDGTTRMQRMIEDLLAYSRVGTRGKPFEPTDLEAVLNQAMTNLKVVIEENKAQITHDTLPTVTVDATQMVQLFQNLISNAIKFRKKEELPRIYVSAQRRGNEWLFSVQDNGIGIAPEFMGRLFQLFAREHTATEYPGTGIGLAVCKRIVERHRGRIWAESNVGKGTVFYLTIPVRRSEQL